MHFRIASLLACLAGLALLCLTPSVPAQRKKENTVIGNVTYKGKPLSDGLVTFTTDKANTSSQILPNGVYLFRKLPVGPVKVSVVSKTVIIPKKYSDPKTSGLKFKVEEGDQIHDINLK